MWKWHWLLRRVATHWSEKKTIAPGASRNHFDGWFRGEKPLSPSPTDTFPSIRKLSGKLCGGVTSKNRSLKVQSFLIQFYLTDLFYNVRKCSMFSIFSILKLLKMIENIRGKLYISTHLLSIAVSSKIHSKWKFNGQLESKTYGKENSFSTKLAES